MVLSTNKACVLVLLFTSEVTWASCLTSLSHIHQIFIECLCEQGNVLGTEDKTKSLPSWSMAFRGRINKKKQVISSVKFCEEKIIQDNNNKNKSVMAVG